MKKTGKQCFLLVSIPAHGHALPLLGLGAALQRRGHTVLFATSAFFVPTLARYKHENVSFLPLEDGIACEAGHSRTQTRNRIRTRALTQTLSRLTLILSARTLTLNHFFCVIQAVASAMLQCGTFMEGTFMYPALVR